MYMALIHISYHKATCDNPGCAAAEVNDTIISLSAYRRNLREKGWLIGRKNALCPICACKPSLRKSFNMKQKEIFVILPVAELRNVLAAEWGDATIRLLSDADHSENKGMLVPRYTNGTILHIREGWIPATKTVIQYENGEAISEETYEGLIYRADEAEHFPDCPAQLDPEFFLSEITRQGVWRSSATMSRNAVRLHLKVKETRFCKIHHGKRYYCESAESATKFNWVEAPWYEEIIVERYETNTK